MQKLPVIRNNKCQLCELSYGFAKKPKNVCLMEPEIKQADVMLIVESPVNHDDFHGMAFAHPLLRSIQKMYEDAGFSVYVTYAVKCLKTDQNVDIKPNWITTCAEAYLSKEIEQVRPKHIITFGANVLKALGIKTKWSKLTGNRHFLDSVNAYVYTTLHVAQALYNMDKRQLLMNELKVFIEWIQGDMSEKDFNPTVEIVDSYNRVMQVLDECSNAEIIACDTETTGKDPFDPKGNIRCIQISPDNSVGYVIPLTTQDTDIYGHLEPFVKQMPAPLRRKDPVPLKWQEALSIRTYEEYVEKIGAPYYVPHPWSPNQLKNIMEKINLMFRKVRVTWHNGKFDRLWLYMWSKRTVGFPVLANRTYMDTIQIAFLLNENRLLGLKKLITEELGYPTYDIGDKVTRDLEELYPYAGKDTVATFLLMEKYSEILNQSEYEKMRRFYLKVIRQVDLVFTDIELKGWPVSKEVADKYRVVLEKKSCIAKKRMEKVLIQDYKIDPEEVSKINFGSPQQLGELIFDVLKLPMNPDTKVALTKTGKKATDEDALFHLISTNKFVKYLFVWRGINKELSTYVLPMIVAAETRGRITTSYKLTGTVTGRTASSAEKEGRGAKPQGMNLQNLPRQGKIRNAVRVADDEDLIEADFSQIELRIAGELSKDPFLLDAYSRGADIHTLRAMRMLSLSTMEEWEQYKKENPKVAKEARSNAKPVNFGFLYGMSAHKFQRYALVEYGVNFTMKECIQERNRYFEDHTGLEAWYGRIERLVEKYGYIESLSGRRRHLPNISFSELGSREARMKRQEAIRMAINTPVQSFASDLKLMSLIEIHKELAQFNGEAYLIGEVHDSILVVCKKQHTQKVAALMVRIMRHPSILDELGITLKVPIEADVKVGRSLGEAQDYDGYKELLVA